MRRANEIKILDTNERELKTRSFSFSFHNSFNLNQLSSLFYELKKNESHQKTSPIISIFS